MLCYRRSELRLQLVQALATVKDWSGECGAGAAGAESQQESEPLGAEGLQSAGSMSHRDMQRRRSTEGDGYDAISEQSAQRGPSPANSLGQRDWMDKIVDGPRVKFQTKAERLRQRSILAPGGQIATLARL